jgi:Flp pilus assembly protein TadB
MHPAFSGIWILLLCLVVIGSIGLGLMMALIIFVFSRRNRETPPQITVHNQESPHQTDMSQVMKRIEDYHREDTQRQNRWHFQSLGYVLLGFCLATTGLAIAKVTPLATIVSAIEAAVFFLGALFCFIHSNRFRQE